MLGVSFAVTQLLDLLDSGHHGAKHLGISFAVACELTDNAVGFVCYDIAYGFVDVFHGNSFRWLVKYLLR